MNVTLDGHNLRNEYGLGVLNHEGKFTLGTRKGNTMFSFPDEDGHHPFVDEEDIKYEANTITLTCVLYGSTQENFMKNYRDLKSLIEKPGLRKLKIPQIDGTIHEVYVKDGARLNIRGKWKNGQIVSNEFDLPFVEPDPLADSVTVKTTATAAVTGTVLTTNKALVVDYGDGNTANVTSAASNLNYDYTGTSGTKVLDITLQGGLKDVTQITLASYDLTGSISQRFGHCKNLATLDLSGNSLDTYETTEWNVPDGISINVSANSTLLSASVSQWFVDLANGRPDGTVPQNGSFDATGCDGTGLTYAELTAEGQAAHDDLVDNNGWTITLDI